MTPIVEVRNVSKAFGGSKVLDDVTFAVNRGEVHALTGENGAGKSTLVKILAGLLPPDSGEVVFHGRGVAMIHQELMPFPEMTVAENICIGREPVRFAGWLDRPAMSREAATLLDRLGTPLDPNRRMGELSVAEMQMVEIARALGRRAELLILDEPTSALSNREVDKLLRLIEDLRAHGVTMIYISHRMNEIFRIANTITVLRDGRHVATQRTEEQNEANLIAMMVGRQFTPAAPAAAGHLGGVVLEGGGLSVRAGEILGIAGLMGAGRTELVWSLFAGPSTIRVQGRKAHIRKPADAIAQGIVLVTEDRRASGVIPDMTVAANITLASLKSLSRGPFVDAAREKEAAAVQIEALGIRAASPHQPVKYLSGGNQQKVVIAKALLTDPKVVILDEPTRGIDVGAKAEIYGILQRLAGEGKAIIVVSSELPELLSLTHRILVMRGGRISAELITGQTTEEEVLRHAMPQ